MPDLQVKRSGIKAAGAVHRVMRNQHGGVMVKHPALPGRDMVPAGLDHMETPPGSSSQAMGGISGGLAPYQQMDADRNDT